MRMTRSAVDALKVNTEKDQFFWDEDLPSFGVRVYKSGLKSYILRKRIGVGRDAKSKMFIIGNCLALTPIEARAKAMEIAVEARKGNDGTRPKAAEMTVVQAFEYYNDTHAKNLKWPKEPGKAMRGLVFPMLGKRKIVDLTARDIIALQASHADRSRAQANKAVRHLSAVINHVRAHFPELHSVINPCQFVKCFHINGRRVYVEHEKMPALLEAIRKEPNPYGRAAVLLYILLGQRKTEILRTRRSDIDFKGMRIHFPSTKNGKSHDLPLSKEALDIIKQIPPVLGSPWLFPSMNAKTKYTGKDHLKDIRNSWSRIKDAAGIKGITIQDLRRTLGSWMVQDGESLEIIGSILNHSGPQVTHDHYAHFSDKPRREALERHAANVFSIPKAKGQSKASNDT